MKLTVHAVILTATVAWLPNLIAPALAQVSPEFSNPKIQILENTKGDGGYWNTTLANSEHPARPISPDRVAVRQRMMQRRVLEEYVEFLSPLRLPRLYRAFASDCDGNSVDSPYYSSNGHFMNLCYSFIGLSETAADYLVQNQAQLKLWTPVSKDQLIAGLFAAVVLHETGHAIFDLMNVPVFGREEDAADQMAAFIALQFDKDTARTIIKGFAYFWAYEANIAKQDPGAAAIAVFNPNIPNNPDTRCQLDAFCKYSDEHGTASQRMYNAVCLAYGGNHAWFQDFIDAHWLPPDRVKDCDSEYHRAYLAFGKTVYPFIDQAQMAKVKARQWFQPEELKEK